MPATHLAAGHRLGPYEIVGPLGAGGMGEVYRALDTRLDRIVAIKVLSAASARDPDARQWFEREARTISSLNHPNICALYDIGVADGLHFIVMEYLEGKTLATILESGPAPPQLLLKTAIEIADALNLAHRRGIIHRDIKPTNIVLTDSGAKLLDFGIARLRHSDGNLEREAGDTPVSAESALTEHGRIAGTVAYMSPEQVRGEEVDGRSDLFSFGAVLYEMATGRRRFDGATVDIVREQILNSATSSRARTARVEPDLAAIIEKALQPDRRLRYQRASELRGDLQRLQANTPRESRVRAWIRTGAAAVVLLVLVALAFSWRWLGRPAVPPSVAVLPFKPLQSTAADRSDADIGTMLADALVTELDAVKGVTARPISSASRYGRTGQDPVAAGRALASDFVLDGAIALEGSRLRVNVHLVRVADGVTVWREQFDSPWTDVFRVQDAIAARVVRSMSLTLTGEDRRLVTRRRPRNLDAYEAYLRGRYFWNTRTRNGFSKAIAYFQQAVEKDPDYAAAYAGLADTYVLLGSMPYAVLPSPEAGSKGRAAATRALQIDETLAEAHVSLAFVAYGFEWDWEQGEREFKRAIQLDPEYATAHYWYSLYLGERGRFDEALFEAQRALDLEPLSLVGTYIVGLSHYYARRFDTARDSAGKGLEIAPDFPPARLLLGLVEIAQARYPQAVVEFRRLYDAAPDNSLHAALLAYAYGRSGDAANARRLIARLIEASRGRYVSAAHIGIACIGIDDRASALSWLEKAGAEHSEALTDLKADPLFDPLRPEPRFAALVQRVGLTP